MASRCISAISDLNPEIAGQGFVNQLFTIYTLNAHAQTAIMNIIIQQCRSYISPVVAYPPVVGCISRI